MEEQKTIIRFWSNFNHLGPLLFLYLSFSGFPGVSICFHAVLPVGFVFWIYIFDLPGESLINFQAFVNFTKSTRPQVHGFAYPWIHEIMIPRIHESMIYEFTTLQSTNLRIHESINPRIHESTSQSSYLGVPPTPHCVLPTAFCTLYQNYKNWHCVALPVLSVLWYGSLFHSVNR